MIDSLRANNQTDLKFKLFSYVRHIGAKLFRVHKDLQYKRLYELTDNFRSWSFKEIYNEYNHMKLGIFLIV